MLRVPRTRGALSGFLLIVLGAWGALIPFIGPYFHFAYTPDTVWTYTTGRLWLEIVPGVASVLGGLILLTSALRPTAMLGAGLATAAGAWFAVGTLFQPLGPGAGWFTVGSPAGLGSLQRVTEQLGLFTGLGVVIVFFGATALGRLSVIGVVDARLAGLHRRGAAAEEEAEAEAEAKAEKSRVPETGRATETSKVR
jgi:hypothetical protein